MNHLINSDYNLEMVKLCLNSSSLTKYGTDGRLRTT